MLIESENKLKAQNNNEFNYIINNLTRLFLITK